MNWTPLEAGTTTHGRYRVEKLLGQGGFGAAYLCADLERFEEPCVLKELRPDAGVGEKAWELFEREAKVLLSLSHPSIPKMHAFFQSGERFYLIQEFVDGQTLEQVVRERGTLPEPQVRDYVVQVLEVLRYLQARNPAIIHRDIKPSNLIVDRQGRVYVIDFGAVLESMTRLQDSGNPYTVGIGTAGYTPLEQAMGTPVLSSDLYALGATALHLVTGTPPSEWHDPITGRMTGLSGRTGCSAEFEQVIAKLLADLAENRYKTAAEAIAALGGHPTAPTAPAGGMPTTPTGPPPEPAATVVHGPSSAEDADVWVSEPSGGSKATMKRVGLGAGVLLTAGAVWFITSAGGGTGSDEPDVAVDSSAPVATAEAVDSAPVATAEALPLPLLANTTTRAGLGLSVNYPATWQLTADGPHLAIRDPGSGTVFVTGMERSLGPQGPPGTLASQLTSDPGEQFGQIAITEALPPSGDMAPFRLSVFRGGNAEAGTLVIRQFTAGNETFSLWWMTLGNTQVTAPTVQSMAETIVTSAN